MRDIFVRKAPFMARIMCTQKLWRALGHVGQPPVQVPEAPVIGATLGSWALKLFHHNRKGLVLALNDRTYLTLVFAAAPRDGFRSRFVGALRNALEDLRVPRATVDQEATALDVLPLARLTNRSMTGSLNDLEFLCRCELDYITDLRRVQWNLNEVPHVRREPSVPIAAVKQFFSAVPRQRATERIH